MTLSIIFLQNIVADQEKMMPEIKTIQASLPSDLSKEESMKQLIEKIETKYPNIIENRKWFEFSSVYDEVFKAIETGKNNHG